MHKYQQKIWTKQSPRDKMIRNRTFGVTPGCIPDPKKGYKRFERWLKHPRKAIELYWRVRGVKTWRDMQGRNHARWPSASGAVLSVADALQGGKY